MWISVKDGVHDIYRKRMILRYLVTTGIYKVVNEFIESGYYDIRDARWRRSRDNAELSNVTHWMPLPDIPKLPKPG